MESFSITLVPFVFEGKKNVKFILEGELTIKNAKEIRQSMDAAISEHEGFEVVLENVLSLDVTFLQLLYSMEKTIRSQQKTMDLKMNLTAEIENILKYNGLEHMLQSQTFRESL